MKENETRYFHVEKYSAWFSNDNSTWLKGRLQGVQGQTNWPWLSNDNNSYKYIKFNSGSIVL